MFYGSVLFTYNKYLLFFAQLRDSYSDIESYHSDLYLDTYKNICWKIEFFKKYLYNNSNFLIRQLKRCI